jgi:hypothetical protein
VFSAAGRRIGRPCLDVSQTTVSETSVRVSRFLFPPFPVRSRYESELPGRNVGDRGGLRLQRFGCRSRTLPPRSISGRSTSCPPPAARPSGSSAGSSTPCRFGGRLSSWPGPSVGDGPIRRRPSSAPSGLFREAGCGGVVVVGGKAAARISSLFYLQIDRFSSGGTRTRTGGTMILSPRTVARVRPVSSWYVTYLSQKLHLRGTRYTCVRVKARPSFTQKCYHVNKSLCTFSNAGMGQALPIFALKQCQSVRQPCARGSLSRQESLRASCARRHAGHPSTS